MRFLFFLVLLSVVIRKWWFVVILGWCRLCGICLMWIIWYFSMLCVIFGVIFMEGCGKEWFGCFFRYFCGVFGIGKCVLWGFEMNLNFSIFLMVESVFFCVIFLFFFWVDGFYEIWWMWWLLRWMMRWLLWMRWLLRFVSGWGLFWLRVSFCWRFWRCCW